MAIFMNRETEKAQDRYYSKNAFSSKWKEIGIFFSKPFKTNITLEMNKVGKYAYESIIMKKSWVEYLMK